MRNILFAASLAPTAAPVFIPTFIPAFAADLATDLALGTRLGTTPDAVAAALTGMGWEVRKLDTEDGMIEAYAVIGDRMAEIYVDPTTGDVVRISDED